MLAIGSDHAGYALKVEIMKYLDEKNIQYKDFGCNGEKIDYPVIAEKLSNAVAAGENEKGILICGTGIGISIAANKVKGIRAAVCTDAYTTKYTRMHNDANILCMGGRVTGVGVAEEMVDIFLATEFEGGRHASRVNLITEIEKRN